jgi:hypothetical protein
MPGTLIGKALEPWKGVRRNSRVAKSATNMEEHDETNDYQAIQSDRRDQFRARVAYDA